MNINPAHLKDVVTAEIVLEILLSEPTKRLEIVNRYLHPVKEEWEVWLLSDLIDAATQAFMFMKDKPAYTWKDDNERGFDLLERVTGYRP